MEQVRIFNFRCHGFYGWGLTAPQAVEAAIKAGLARRLVKEGKMIKLPQGVTDYGMIDYGTVQWRPGTVDAEELEWNKFLKGFVEKVTE